MTDQPTPEEVRAFQKAVETPMQWEFSGYRGEYTCAHGVGHGLHSHGCDGCCSREDCPLNRIKPLAREAQKAAKKYGEDFQQALDDMCYDYLSQKSASQLNNEGPARQITVLAGLVGVDRVEAELTRLIQIAEEESQ